MPAIETELDRLIDAHAALQRSRRAFKAHRRAALTDAHLLHPLKRSRLNFRGEGITVAELSERSTVSERSIRGIENRTERGSDVTFTRLMRALDCRRDQVDEHWIGR